MRSFLQLVALCRSKFAAGLIICKLGGTDQTTSTLLNELFSDTLLGTPLKGDDLGDEMRCEIKKNFILLEPEAVRMNQSLEPIYVLLGQSFGRHNRSIRTVDSF